MSIVGHELRMVPKDSCSFMVPERRARARPRMSHVVIKFSAKDGDKMREVGRRLHKLWRRCPCFSNNYIVEHIEKWKL
jgi:hypothetical protein